MFISVVDDNNPVDCVEQCHKFEQNSLRFFNFNCRNAGCDKDLNQSFASCLVTFNTWIQLVNSQQSQTFEESEYPPLILFYHFQIHKMANS